MRKKSDYKFTFISVTIYCSISQKVWPVFKKHKYTIKQTANLNYLFGKI